MKSNTTVISLNCVKGGVAKSTDSVNIAYAFANLFPDKKILLIDFDPQATTSDILGFRPKSEDGDEIETIGDLLSFSVMNNLYIGIEDIKNIIYRPTHLVKRKIKAEKGFKWIEENEEYRFDLLPNSMTLSLVELHLSLGGECNSDSKYLLHEVVKLIRWNLDYDYILIDSLPSLGILSINVMLASDLLLIPTIMTRHSVKGINYVLTLANKLNLKYNANIETAGIIYNRVHKSAQVDNYFDKMIRKLYPNIHVFETKVYETVEFEKMLIQGKIASHANKKIKEIFESLSLEIINKTDNKE